MEALWIAFAIVLILEGAGPMLFPNRWQRFMAEMASQEPSQLRTLGGVMVSIGAVALLYLLSS